MFSSALLLWVGLGLFLLIVDLYNTPRAKAARARRAEEYLQHEEEQKEEERAKASIEAQQMENFRKQPLVVHIREKNGRKSSFEGILIITLLKNDVSVQFLPNNDGCANADVKSLKDGVLALVGTSWRKEKTGGGYEDHFTGAYIDEYQYEATYCDYRLLYASNGVVNILGAGCQGRASSYVDSLANFIVGDLASIVPQPE